MIETVLVVPVRDNAGQPFRHRDWLALEERLLPFGGFTRTANVLGVWESGGREYRDESR